MATAITNRIVIVYDGKDKQGAVKIIWDALCKKYPIVKLTEKEYVAEKKNIGFNDFIIFLCERLAYQEIAVYPDESIVVYKSDKDKCKQPSAMVYRDGKKVAISFVPPAYENLTKWLKPISPIQLKLTKRFGEWLHKKDMIQYAAEVFIKDHCERFLKIMDE